MINSSILHSTDSPFTTGSTPAMVKFVALL